MNSGTQARADGRALVSAAFIGTSVGLSLGIAYLAGGMGQAALDQNRTAQFAAANGGLAASDLRQGPGPVVIPVSAQDPFTQGPRAAAQLAAADPDAARIAGAQPSRARELECLTQAIYFEARGESARGQAAVATVIMNRVKSPNFPKTVCGVVYQGAARRTGCQFSFACDGRAERVVERSAWTRARQVAARALSGAVLGDIGSATHFHTTEVSPYWGASMKRVAQVGLHVFYRFNPRGSRPAPAQAAPEAPVFASAPVAQPPELRLAAAVLAPTADDAAASAADTDVSETKPEAKPAKPDAAATAPVGKADQIPHIKLDTATAS